MLDVTGASTSRAITPRTTDTVVPIRSQADEALWRVRSDKVRPLASAITAFIAATVDQTDGRMPAPVATLSLSIPGYEDRVFGGYQLTPQLVDVLARAFNLAALDIAATTPETTVPDAAVRPLHLVTAGGAR
ncbi:hypothetical protein [Streptomyces sp. NPDC093589]|uniref:hypothetical protein n=1 Tax=Streptomyces sp. NPDC093589 TaxID=3366043 RepID=UPI00382CC8EF